MYKHFSFQDRVILQYHLDNNPRCSAQGIATILKKSRSAIHYELKTNTSTLLTKQQKFLNAEDNYRCVFLARFPFCCNACAKTRCSHRSRVYNAYQADRKAHNALVKSRSDTTTKKEIVDILNKTLSQLIIDGVSIQVAKASVNRCDVSESTIRRYINKGYLLAKRHHLPNSIRFKVKKEYNYGRMPIDANLLYQRTYQDYLDYIEAHPFAKVVQLDSLIGKADDKSALLTIFFINSKFHLAVKYNRKNSNINSILTRIYNEAAKHGFKLFDVILTDNGPEFRNLPSIEKDDNQVNRLRVFYCDPYRSCQKAECERNHGLIRRILTKGRSFDSRTQSDIDSALSHINSYPRASLNMCSPYDLFTSEYDSIIACILNVDRIDVKDLRLVRR